MRPLHHQLILVRIDERTGPLSRTLRAGLGSLMRDILVNLFDDRSTSTDVSQLEGNQGWNYWSCWFSGSPRAGEWETVRAGRVEALELAGRSVRSAS